MRKCAWCSKNGGGLAAFEVFNIVQLLKLARDSEITASGVSSWFNLLIFCIWSKSRVDSDSQNGKCNKFKQCLYVCANLFWRRLCAEICKNIRGRKFILLNDVKSNKLSFTQNESCWVYLFHYVHIVWCKMKRSVTGGENLWIVLVLVFLV